MTTNTQAVKVPRNRVFAVCVNDNLLYETITSNPKKTARYYKRLDRNDKDTPVELTEFEMKRESVINRANANRSEIYIGPMR